MKIVLTGAPGSGKTTVWQWLKQYFKDAYFVPEAARHLLNRNNYQFPKDIVKFQLDILKLQLYWESKIPSNVPFVFFDRGIWDGLAYYPLAPLANLKHSGYDLILLIEPIFVKPKELRSEREKETLLIHERIRFAYLAKGYDPIPIPKRPVDLRCKIIKEIIEKNKKED